MLKHERETYNVLPHFDMKWPLIGPEAVLLWPYYWEVGCLAHGQESGESLHGGVSAWSPWGLLLSLPGEGACPPAFSNPPTYQRRVW